MKKIYLVFLLSVLVVAGSFGAEPKLDPKEAKAIAKEAYIYGLPMVLNYKTMYSYVLDKNSPEYIWDVKPEYIHLKIKPSLLPIPIHPTVWYGGT